MSYTRDFNALRCFNPAFRTAFPFPARNGFRRAAQVARQFAACKEKGRRDFLLPRPPHAFYNAIFVNDRHGLDPVMQEVRFDENWVGIRKLSIYSPENVVVRGATPIHARTVNLAIPAGVEVNVGVGSVVDANSALMEE